MRYVYDGSFDGFLCCVFRHYREEKASGIFPAPHYQESLTETRALVDTDTARADRVREAIERKISAHDLGRIYTAFCAADPDKEMSLLRYIRLGFREGSRLRLLHAHPDVFRVEQSERRVMTEVHRIYGLLRFSELKGGILYAPFEPDHDILAFLAEHFCDRLKNDPFVIHDRRRGKALFAAGGASYISLTDGASPFDDPLISETETERACQRLWREYFDTVAIRERANPACQRRFMPLRYHKYLREMGGIRAADS